MSKIRFSFKNMSIFCFGYKNFFGSLSHHFKVSGNINQHILVKRIKGEYNSRNTRYFNVFCWLPIN